MKQEFENAPCPMTREGARVPGAVPPNGAEAGQTVPEPPAAPAAPLPELPCDACRDLIPLVQDGAASDASVRLVAQHIAHCPDCLAFWQAGAPPQTPDDGRVLSKIHRRLRLLQGAALVLGVLAAFWLGAFGTHYRLEYSIVILPVVGALGWLFLRRRWYWVPLAVGVLGFLWHALLQGVGGPNWHVRIVVPLLCAAIYSILCLLGALAAKLFAYAFGKEEPR